MRQDHFVAVCIYFFPYSIANWNLRCVLFLRLLRKFFWFLYITLNAWQIFKSFFFSIFVTALTISSLFFNPFVTLVLSTRKLLHILITSLVNKLPSFESLTSALNLRLEKFFYVLFLARRLRSGLVQTVLSSLALTPNFIGRLLFFISGTGSSCFWHQLWLFFLQLRVCISCEHLSLVYL